jgi:hypothetical protein
MPRLVKYDHVERENQIVNTSLGIDNFDHWFALAVARELTTKQLQIVLDTTRQLAPKV